MCLQDESALASALSHDLSQLGENPFRTPDKAAPEHNLSPESLMSEAEFLPSESSVVVRFKSTQDVNTVRLSSCKNYMPYDFFSMADKLMRLPQHKKMKRLLYRKLSTLTKSRGRPLTLDEKIETYTNVLQSKTEFWFEFAILR